MNPKPEQPWISLGDFSEGIRNSYTNPLNMSERSLWDGENADIVDNYIRTAPGVGLHTSGGVLPSGEVQSVYQFQVPINQTPYLLCQVDSGTSKLYVSTDNLPVSGGSGTWTEIYDLGGDAGRCSYAPLDNRLVIAEGTSRPLIFGGSLDSTGDDWMLPLNVFVTWNSGSGYHNITSKVLDQDGTTAADIGGLDPNSGWLLIAADMRDISGLYFDVLSGNSSGGTCSMEIWSGAWISGSGSVDNSSGMSTDGTLTFSGSSVIGEYDVKWYSPGFHLKVGFSSGTSNNTWLGGVKYSAPIQELRPIGVAAPDFIMSFFYWKADSGIAMDWSTKVSDESLESYATMHDGNTTAASRSGFAAGSGSSDHNPDTDRLYVGYFDKFTGVEIKPRAQWPNCETASISGEYYSGGIGWAAISTLTDGTQSPDGVTLGKYGKISWSDLTDWTMCRPFGDEFPLGYYTRFYTNSGLSTEYYVGEVRVWPEIDPLTKYEYCETFRDRIVLLNRPQARDQLDISRGLEAHGWTGTDMAQLRVGFGEIKGAKQAYNNLFIAKDEAWYILNGHTPKTFALERPESVGQTPCNNESIIVGPVIKENPDDNLGIYYLNSTGAWAYSVLQIYNLAKKPAVNWWEPDVVPRIDRTNLARTCCGVYYPTRNWLVWAVPMITSEGQSEQLTNNRLIIFNLDLWAWLPPRTLSLSTLHTCSSYNANAPDKRGPKILLGGDYNGQIAHLFGDNLTTDFGANIDVWVETGWLHHSDPTLEKEIRRAQHFGRIDTGNMTLKIAVNGDESTWDASSNQMLIDTLDQGGSIDFSNREKSLNAKGRFFKYRWSWTGVAELYSASFSMPGVRFHKSDAQGPQR